MKKFTIENAHCHNVGPPTVFAATHIATVSTHETIDTEIRERRRLTPDICVSSRTEFG